MTTHPHRLIAISYERPFMPRDNDKNNDSRGRRDRPSGGKGRSGAARGPDKKFAKRGFAGKSDDGERRPYAGKPDGAKSFGKKPYAGAGKPYAVKRDGAPPRFNRDDRPARDDGEKRPFKPRGDRPNYNRDDRAPRADRGDARPAARFSDRKFGDKKPYASRDGGSEKRPYTPRGEGFRKDGDRPQRDRPYGDRPRGDRPERKFGGDKKFSRGAPRDRNSGPGDRGPRKSFGDRPERGKEFGADRGDSNPWQKRDASSPDHAGRNSRPSRDGARNFDKPRFDRPREDRPQSDRPRGDRPRFDRPREDRPKFDRPREGRSSREGGSSWQEHPRSDARSSDRDNRPRRDNEDDSKVFAKRPAFGGRGEYRERKPDFDKRAPRPPRE